MTHTFAICAYKESSYLEDCIKSVLKQKVKSNILIATSTPNEHIKGLAEKYGLPLYINEVLTSLNEIDFFELISMNPTNKKKFFLLAPKYYSFLTTALPE